MKFGHLFLMLGLLSASPFCVICRSGEQSFTNQIVSMRASLLNTATRLDILGEGSPHTNGWRGLVLDAIVETHTNSLAWQKAARRDSPTRKSGEEQIRSPLIKAGEKMSPSCQSVFRRTNYAIGGLSIEDLVRYRRPTTLLSPEQIRELLKLLETPPQK